MNRVVADTNIYISALVFGGLSRIILQLAEEKAFVLFTSDAIQFEVEKVLKRKFEWSEEQVAKARRKISQLARFVNPKQAISACEDPDDDRILECALEAEADIIVSGDRHLLDMQQFRDIPIVSARRFLDLKRSQGLP